MASWPCRGRPGDVGENDALEALRDRAATPHAAKFVLTQYALKDEDLRAVRLAVERLLEHVGRRAG